MKTISGEPFIAPLHFDIWSGRNLPGQYKWERRISTVFGRLGKSLTGLVVDKRFQELPLKLHFKELRGFFLTLHKNALPSEIESASFLFSFLIHGRLFGRNSQLTDDQIVSEIVALHDNGETITRDAYRQMLASNMKHEAWRALWAQTVTQRPSLLKPGPRKP